MEVSTERLSRTLALGLRVDFLTVSAMAEVGEAEPPVLLLLLLLLGGVAAKTAAGGGGC
jgi:hypothetical protein